MIQITQQQQQQLQQTSLIQQRHTQPPLHLQMGTAQLQRSDSDQSTTSTILSPLELLMKSNPLIGAALQQQQPQLFPATPTTLQFPLLNTANIMIPSPSLPNLCNGLLAANANSHLFGGGGAASMAVNGDGVAQLGGSGGVALSQSDYANLMMQASTFASFLSMPSLLRTHAMFQPTSILSNPQAIIGGTAAGDQSSATTGATASGGTQQRATVKFDSTARNAQPPLPIGGYPSLLKQQLRDLVLRRKSLVREEPEEQMSEAATTSSAADALATIAQKWKQKQKEEAMERPTLKTGLAYDPTMSKHQCLCAENNNHVEHGGRVQSIW